MFLEAQGFFTAPSDKVKYRIVSSGSWGQVTRSNVRNLLQTGRVLLQIYHSRSQHPGVSLGFDHRSIYKVHWPGRENRFSEMMRSYIRKRREQSGSSI